MTTARSKRFHTASGQVPGNIPIRCSFFLPVKEGENPVPAEVSADHARELLRQTSLYLAQQREEVARQFEPPPRDSLAMHYMAQVLEKAQGIRTHGRLVVGHFHPERARVTAGSVWPIMRLACIRPEDKYSMFVIAHELAHLAGVGDVDEVTLLLRPEDLKATDLQMLSSGWGRTTFAPVTRVERGWAFDADNFVHKGFFFEEAMAELVQLKYEIDLDEPELHLDEPVTFKGKSMVFQVPVEYGHSVAGWGILMLEQACPGVAGLLMAGAKGRSDYPLLRRIIEARFPGLFQMLYDVDLPDGLARGTELILERLNR